MTFAVPNFLLIAAAVAPALFLLALLALLPKSVTRWAAPRPLWTVAIATLTGVGSAFIALPVEMLLTSTPWRITNLGVLAVFALVAAGLAEEGAKYLVVRFYSWRLAPFRERYDGLLYGGAVGLGFGALENVFYVSEGGLETAMVRALTAVPFHGMLGLVMGYFLGRAKVRQLAGERWGGLHALGLFWAVLLHGLYDFFAFQASQIALVLLNGLLVVMALWCLRTVISTRALSPSWGGCEPAAPTPFVPPPAVARNPMLAGILGLVPGLGQFYNREWQKGLFLLAAGIINLVLLASVWLLLNAPQAAIEALFVLAGLSLAIKPEQFIQTLAAAPVLQILLALNAVFCLLSAFDAYRTARSGRFDYLKAPEKRIRFLQTFSASYVGHVLLLFFAVLVPVIAGGGPKGQGEQPGQIGTIEFDLVTTPKKLDGFSGKPEGTAKGTAKKNAPKVVAQKSAPVPVPGPQAPKAQEAQEAKGLPRSYNEYLSWKIRRYHDLYFDRVGTGQYTVVQYEIDSVGNVTNVQVLYDHTTAPGDVAEMAAETVRRLDPALPLPKGIRSVTITELFWDGSPIGSPGSLEQHLSELPDGREVMPYPPEQS
ncbi:PrsW family intramembrane metalloprotease [Gloeobacter violaceus]|uniref:Glr0655 protein n=1 Tax=Gloeobacter violaceus (strain ATCC 29082 / PCC 7421) TaxID=251221 RepID=Q7NMW0_GLOVI|nr:PrsW family glutamic-type intramembrane protease [Gloeobacter violaceus]BAC88596.1 glr0655 [Gloeobacter violaceus PCC 7421]